MAGISGDVAALLVGGGSNSITIFNHCICCTRSASVSCFSPRICLSSSSTSFCRLPRRFALSAYPMVKTAPIPTGRVSDLIGFVGDLRSNVYCGAAQLISSSHHEFRDDGAEVEVRVPIPVDMEGSDGAAVSARHMQVDTQDTTLSIAVQTSQGVQLLFSAPRLYGRVKTSETIWYVDDNEIILSLKKMDTDLKWPALLEGWMSLTTGVSELLKGTSIYVVGASTAINWAVAKELATGLGYVFLFHLLILWVSAEGYKSVTEAEDMILSSLSSHVRCVVATLGGHQGIAAQNVGWNGLHAGFTVWLSQSNAADEVAAEEEAAKAKQEGVEAYAQADVVVALAGWDENSARPAAEGSLRALKYLLEADKELPGKKSLYLRLGCRGDWPNIMPPGWDPATGKQQQPGKAIAL
ncbi:unnamed protein product [Sphagnum jensenii]|uniref:CS domain-containing protein n=1 Tax=Sphagnum jensenii TaxID=128206 RepID=A0ABP0W4I4_9BRYO